MGCSSSNIARHKDENNQVTRNKSAHSETVTIETDDEDSDIRLDLDEDVDKWLSKLVKEITCKAQHRGDFAEALDLSVRVLGEIKDTNTMDKIDATILGNLHDVVGLCYCNMENYDKAMEHYRIDEEIATKHSLNEHKSRAIDNIGKVHAQMGNHRKAIEIFEAKLPSSQSDLETTWLCHEIGRCYMELNQFQEALNFGMKSKRSAEAAGDEMWTLNAHILIAQSQVKLQQYEEAHVTFHSSLQMAKTQRDEEAIDAIETAIMHLSQFYTE